MTTQKDKSGSKLSLQKFWTIAQLAEALGCCELTIRRMVADGRFPEPLRIGKRLIRWADSDLQAFLEQR